MQLDLLRKLRERRNWQPLVWVAAGLAICVSLFPAPAQAQGPVPSVCTSPEPVLLPEAPLVLRVEVSTQEQISDLAGAYDVWEVHADDGYIVIGATAGDLERLTAGEYGVLLLAEQTVEVQQAIHTIRGGGSTCALNAPVESAAVAGTSEVPGIPGLACYRTAREIERALYSLAAAWPTLAQVVDIGDSWEKVTSGGLYGSDLLALEITNRERPGPKAPVVLMASIHARELASSEAALRFAESLLASYGRDANSTWMLDNNALYLLPMVNPDGRAIAETGFLWRKNTHATIFCGIPTPGSTHGVDLNRNSTFQWGGCTVGGCSSSYGCSLVYRGETAGSEPETQAIERYISTVFADQRLPDLTSAAPVTTTGVFLSLHSYGEKVLRPWSYTDMPAPNADGLQAVGDRYAAFTSYYSCQTAASDCLYGADGSTDDWVYGTFGVAAHTFEMGQAFFASCTSLESDILPGVLDALDYALRIAHQPYVLAKGPLVASMALTDTVTAPAESGASGVLTISAGDPLRLSAVLATMPAASPPNAVERTHAIGSARWSLDLPTWAALAGGPLEAVDGTFGGDVEAVRAEIDTSGWEGGRHLVFVQGVDPEGNGGAPSALFVDVIPGAAAAAPDREQPRFRHYVPLATLR